MIDIGFVTPGGTQLTGTETQRLAVGEPRALTPSAFRQCPKCGAAALIRRENCDICTSCEYEKCG